MTKFLNISTDNTLGGDNPSDEVVSSQKAIKTVLDSKADDSTVVHLTGSETIDQKTFKTTGSNSSIRINNTTSSPVIEFDKVNVAQGFIGVDAFKKPFFAQTLSGTWNNLVRSTLNSAVGSSTTPVYIDSNGVAQSTGIDLATKQNTTDNTLTTTDKTIVGAINEINAKPSMPELDEVTITTNSDDELQAIGLVGLTASIQELNYVDGVTSNIQAQLDTKSNFPLFYTTWSDHLINDQSWLRADTFSWQNGTVYSNAYEHLTADIEDKTLTSETISDVTIQYYLADDGHKICPASQEANVLSLYNTTGIAWYYILDTTNERFKLPRTKFGFVGLRDEVGKFVPESLPNITGIFGSCVATSYGEGAFYNVAQSVLTAGVGGYDSGRVGFNASRSSSTYQDNAHVQQKSTQMYLYFYVGEFSQSATQQTAGLNAELFNGKVDVDSLIEINPMIESYVNGTEGYNIWANGYCEQWGNANTIAPDSGKDITFLKTYKDTYYNVTVSIWAAAPDNDSSPDDPCHVRNLRVNGMRVCNSAIGNTVDTKWKASGYLAEGEY